MSLNSQLSTLFAFCTGGLGTVPALATTVQTPAGAAVLPASGVRPSFTQAVSATGRHPDIGGNLPARRHRYPAVQPRRRPSFPMVAVRLDILSSSVSICGGGLSNSSSPPILTYRASQFSWPPTPLLGPKAVLQWLACVLQWVGVRSLEIAKFGNLEVFTP